MNKAPVDSKNNLLVNIGAAVGIVVGCFTIIGAIIAGIFWLSGTANRIQQVESKLETLGQRSELVRMSHNTLVVAFSEAMASSELKSKISKMPDIVANQREIASPEESDPKGQKPFGRHTASIETPVIDFG